MMVRLEVAILFAHALETCLFQFHDGAIGSNFSNGFNVLFIAFQFHDGAIGRRTFMRLPGLL